MTESYHMIRRLYVVILGTALLCAPAWGQSSGNPLTNLQTYAQKSLVPNGAGSMTGNTIAGGFNLVVPIITAMGSFDSQGVFSLSAGVLPAFGGDVTCPAGNPSACVVTRFNGNAVAAIATSGSASDLTSGILNGARMPSLSGDCSSTSGTTALSCTKTGGVSFAASATIDTTNAGNIASGTLSAARLPAPTVSTLGGVKSGAGAAHQYQTGIDSTGTPTFAQPTVGDVTGALNKAGDTMIGPLLGNVPSSIATSSGFTTDGAGNKTSTTCSATGYGNCYPVSIANMFYFAGEWTHFGMQSVIAHADPNYPSAAFFANITSTAGGSNLGQPSSPFAAAILAHATAADGGVGAVGLNLNCDLAHQTNNSALVGCSGTEDDINNSDADRGGDIYHSPNFAIGVLANGGGTHQNNAAFESGGGTGAFPLWYAGIEFAQSPSATSTAIKQYTIHDETGSTFGYLDEGTHSFGLQLNGTYSTTAFGSPGYRIDGSGNAMVKSVSAGPSINGAAAYADSTSLGTSYIDTGTHTYGATYAGTYSNSAIKFAGSLGTGAFFISALGFSVDGVGNTVTKTVKVTPTTYAALPTCNSGAEGTYAAITDATGTTFNSTAAGGGTNHMPVYCNGTNWTLH